MEEDKQLETRVQEFNEEKYLQELNEQAYWRTVAAAGALISLGLAYGLRHEIKDTFYEFITAPTIETVVTTQKYFPKE